MDSNGFLVIFELSKEVIIRKKILKRYECRLRYKYSSKVPTIRRNGLQGETYLGRDVDRGL